MINAFGVCRSIATRHEAMIAQRMQAEARQLRKPDLPARPSKFGNSGTSPERDAQTHMRWLEIADRIRAFLETKPAATTVDVRDHLGVNTSNACAWMTKMRMNQDLFAIKARWNTRTKRWHYWRAEDYTKGTPN